MVKTKVGFILAAAFLSGIAALLSIASLGTEEWVVAEGIFTAGTGDPPSEIKYGLFSGTYFRISYTPTYYEISMTCLVSENVCAYLCNINADARKQDLKKIFAGENVSFNSSACPQVRRTNHVGEFIDHRYLRAKDQREYLNAGLYISTVIFLCLSAIFGIMATALSVWNMVSNPVEIFLSIYGLYIYNGIASVANIFALVLWGALFGTTAVNNVAILETIQGQMNSYANLGYSYWLNLPSAMLYFCSMGVLFTRQYLISQEPEIKIHTTSGDKDVGEIMIY